MAQGPRPSCPLQGRAPDHLAELTLAGVQELGPRRFAALVARFGSARAVLSCGRRRLLEAGVPAELAGRLGSPPWDAARRDLDWARARGLTVLGQADEDYPGLLRELPDAPPVLFVQGQVASLSRPAVAIVGSRRATPAACRLAERMAAQLAAAGLVIVSGLALGIDAAAHRGALLVDGASLAVCGRGLADIYPRCHRGLARELLERGALLCELPPHEPPRRANFPRRNRLISGLCRGVVVVEAAHRSGSLITAFTALEQGREVMAVPGTAGAAHTAGSNGLLRRGAVLVECAADVLAEVAPQLGVSGSDLLSGVAARPASTAAPSAAQGEEARVLAVLADAPLSADGVASHAEVSLPRTRSLLLALELGGAVVSLPGGLWAASGRTVEGRDVVGGLTSGFGES